MIDKNGLAMLKDFIKDKRNFDIGQYKDSYIERRVKTRMTLTHTSNITSYINLLKKDPEEFKKMLDALTVNVTEFFRNPETFEVLEHEIIPDIIKQKEHDSRDIIKVWSAGCSSGEETYTLTILFLEALRKSGKDYKLVIQGTDIDRQSIIKARIGSYEPARIQCIRKDLLDRYFEKHNDEYRIQPWVKEYIKFSYLDMTSEIDKNPSTYELIVCRNVLIYFKEDMKKQTYIKFCNMLRKHGYLLLGKNESISGVATEYLENVNLSERIYKKKHAELQIKLST